MRRVVPAISEYRWLDDGMHVQTWGRDDTAEGATRVEVHDTDAERIVRAQAYLGSRQLEALDEGASVDPDTTEVVLANSSALAVACHVWRDLGLPMKDDDPFEQLSDLAPSDEDD